MSEEWLSIGADSVDVQAIMADIHNKVAEKKKQGVYDQYDLEGISVLDIKEINSEEDFLNYYLEVLQHSSDVDIGDFEIPSKGGLFGKIEANLKRIIWIVMRFYTYRLFSQQKEYNFQVVNTLISMNKKLEEKVSMLEKRIQNLEKS